MILEEGQAPPSRPTSVPRQSSPPSNASTASTFSLSPFPPRPHSTTSSSPAYAHPHPHSHPHYTPLPRTASPGGDYAYTGGSAFDQFPRLERASPLGGVGSWLGGRHGRTRVLMALAGASLVFLLHAHFFRVKHGGPPPWARHPQGGPPPWVREELAAKAVEAARVAGVAVLPPGPPGVQVAPGVVGAVPIAAPARNQVGEVVSFDQADEAEAVRFSQLPIADERPYILPPRKTPSSIQPWASLPKSWIGHSLLSTKRFPLDNEAAGMHDPPELLSPPAPYLDEAYAYAASLAGQPHRNPHASAPAAFDARGRPLQVPRKDLVLTHRGWRPLKLKVSELGAAGESGWPRVQAEGPAGPDRSTEERARRAWVKRAFAHAWEGYKAEAWGHDELLPLGGEFEGNRTGKDR